MGNEKPAKKQRNYFVLSPQIMELKAETMIFPHAKTFANVEDARKYASRHLPAVLATYGTEISEQDKLQIKNPAKPYLVIAKRAYGFVSFGESDGTAIQYHARRSSRQDFDKTVQDLEATTEDVEKIFSGIELRII